MIVVPSKPLRCAACAPTSAILARNAGTPIAGNYRPGCGFCTGPRRDAESVKPLAASPSQETP